MFHPPTATPPSEPDRPGPSGDADADTGTDAPRPAEPRQVEVPVPERLATDPLGTRPLATGGESVWPARFVRLGAARPGPEARRARWFGVPLLPLLTAALVAGAFLSARGGSEGGGLADGRPGGDPVGAPAPVVTGGTGPTAGTADTPGAGTPPNSPATGGTPTRTAPEDRAGHPQGSTSAEPSRPGSAAPANGTSPTAGTPAPERSVSYEALRVGDCFDIDRDAPGTALRRRCDTPHHAELVARPRLVGTFATDRAVRDAATVLCREPLRLKAARQPLGTRWTTFVQYPYLTSHLLGSDRVACSLAVLGGTLSHRLQ